MATCCSKAVGDDEARPFVKLAGLPPAAALPVPEPPPAGKAGSEPPRVRAAWQYVLLQFLL